MADKGIIFSAPMVRAILDGRKTQTRRVLKPQPYEYRGEWWITDRVNGDCQLDDWTNGRVGIGPPYAPGDRLWVKEAWRSDRAYDDLPPSEMSGEEPLIYLADNAVQLWGWKPDAMSRWGRYRHARFMPRWASRLTLIVEDVRVQRLGEISEADAEAEGAAPKLHDQPKVISGMGGHRGDFRALWDSLHGPDAWDQNPWVCAITFRPVFGNIDSITGGEG
jgi:hypothetical protein